MDYIGKCTWRICLEWRGHSLGNQRDGLYRRPRPVALPHPAQTQNVTIKENGSLRNSAGLPASARLERNVPH